MSSTEESLSEIKVEDIPAPVSEKIPLDTPPTEKMEVVESEKQEVNFSQKLPTKWTVCELNMIFLIIIIIFFSKLKF